MKTRIFQLPLLTLFFCFIFSSCSELQQIASTFPQGTITNTQIAEGLRQALDFGIDKQVSKLAEENGFYQNQAVKILLPEQLQKVDNTLRQVGLSNLADEGLKVLNRAAESAVKEATPIFVDAVKQITFNDAKNILLGSNNAATTYLQSKTTNALYSKFSPVIKSSLDKVGATEIWATIITKYNAIPLTSNVNPDLTDYVTQQALKGVFTMIAKEELDIRTDISARTTLLLQRVFALQDNKN
ncbi:DUF4197 domain-containing protein [Zhouia sp. PK063]|uniref:DUF4197 domain-containing protein n=1 Tax=Zhouia sp. PK063 TaxID=3373602 RepID=UPI0037B3FD3F